MRSAEIAEKYGCRIIHGIVDSLWLQDIKGRSIEEFEEITKNIATEITEETNIPMSWDGRFNFIVFLPSKAEPDIPALSHYWGIKSDGEVKVRGIEVRRRDMPKVIKDAQKAFINVFKGAFSIEEFMQRIPEAKKELFNFINKILEGSLSRDDLTIKQRISRRPSQYKVNSYQAVAAKQLERSGVIASPGKNINYIILNADANPEFPEKKVVLSDLYDEKRHQYDRKKYIELLKRAFENIFPFEFPELENILNLDLHKNSTQINLNNFLFKE